MRRAARWGVGVAAGVAALAAVAMFRPARPTPGRWAPYRTHRFDARLTEEQRAEIAELEALGYVGGSVPAGDQATGVLLHTPDAFVGPRLYVSGEGPVARVIDENGAVLHAWRGDFWAAFPGYPVDADHGLTENWRRARLVSDGSLVAIHEGLGMVRLDAASHLLWANPARYHHDLHVVGDEIVALAREARVIPAIDPVHPVLEDRVAWIRLADGVELRSLSVLDALQKSAFAVPLRADGDLLHTNALVVLDGSLAQEEPSFAAGNILVSFRETSTLAVIDPAAERVVWARQGPWLKQHDPQPDGRGSIVLFDNLGGERGSARVLWLDPLGAVRRTWAGPPLRSPILGAVAPLADGAVWVTESLAGTVWEVDPTGRLRWVFANPARTGDHSELIAAIFEMEPVDPSVLAALR